MSDTYTGVIDPALSLTLQSGQFFPDNDDRQGTLVEINSLPGGASVDGVFYFNSSSPGKYLKRVIDGPVRAVHCGIYGDGTDQTSKINTAISNADIDEIVFDDPFGADILISGTVTVPSGKKLTFSTGNKLVGSGTVSGGIISGLPNQQMLADTITLNGVRTPDNIFYAAWYGAVGDNVTDNIIMLQKAADYIATNTVNVKTLQLGGGTYKISTGLIFYKKNGIEYDQINFIFRGTTISQSQNSGLETILELTSNDSFCLGIQEGKGALVENIGLKGNNALTYTPAQVFDPESTFILGSQRANRYSPQVGLVIDPFHNSVAANDQYPGFSGFYTNASNGGSTTCVFKNLYVNAFVAGIVMSPSGGTQNNEGHLFDHIWLANMREGIVTCNSQERTVKLSNINCWARTKTVFTNIAYGDQRGDVPKIDVVNIAGAIYQFCEFSGGQGQTIGSFSNVYCEQLYKIGSAGSMATTFINCQFHLYNVEAIGLKPPTNIYRCGVTQTLFIGCTIVYFLEGAQLRWPMNITGRVKFINCKLNNQAGTQYANNTLFNLPEYDRVDFYAFPGFINKGDLLSSAANYGFSGQGATIHYIPFGTNITTMGGGSGPTLSNGWKAKQVRKSLSPLVRRVPIGNLTVTVTGSTATAINASLANVTAYNGLIVYSNTFTYTSGSLITGGHVMRVVSIDGSGLISFDRVVEDFAGGTHTLFVEQLTTISGNFVADLAGTSLTNVTNAAGAATLLNGGLYHIYGSEPALVTASGSGTATLAYNVTGEGQRIVISPFEYEEWGFSDSNPLTNAFFPNGTFFTKSAFYKKINSTTGVLGWICTKTGIKGTSILPEFTEVLPGNAAPLRSVNVDDTPTSIDNTILVNTGTGNKTITVNPTLRRGDYTIVKASADANTVTISPSTGTISGSASVVLNAQYQSVTIRSDLANFFITAQV